MQGPRLAHPFPQHPTRAARLLERTLPGVEGDAAHAAGASCLDQDSLGDVVGCRHGPGYYEMRSRATATRFRPLCLARDTAPSARLISR